MYREHLGRCFVVVTGFLLAVWPSAAEPQTTSATASADAEIKEYKCDKGYLRLRTGAPDSGLIATVYDDKPYVLKAVPRKASDGPVVTWSDGDRTLTWSPGVVLRWKTATSQKTCVNGVTHHRAADE